VFRGKPFQAYSLEQSYHQNYKRTNNIKLIYLTLTHCTCKSEKHKQSTAHEKRKQSTAHGKRKQSTAHENHEQSTAHEKRKQSTAHEKRKQSFPSENYNRTRHAHARATSADSIPPRSL
jgi:hypothetical protein